MIADGIVESLHIAAAAGTEMQSIEHALVVERRGIDGDRYFHGRGTWSGRPGTGRHVTLIESEALEALARDYGIAVACGQARRNIVTRRVALNHLVGKKFHVGEARLQGIRLCEPCAHLEHLAVPAALRGLVHRGGLRADVLSGGLIRVGDRVWLSNAAF